MTKAMLQNAALHVLMQSTHLLGSSRNDLEGHRLAQAERRNL